MKINIVYGKAGTGKTQELVDLVRSLTGSYVILAPTHNAVNNIFLRFNKDESIKGKLMTVHAFFRINYKDNNSMIGPRKLVDHIIFDEFSLIHRQIITNIIATLLVTPKPTTLHLFGDPLQLNAVYESDFDNMIFFRDMLRYDKLVRENYDVSLTPMQIKHIHQSNFYNSPVLKLMSPSNVTSRQLTTNHRANDTVMKVLNALTSGDVSFPYTVMSKTNVINAMKNTNTYFIASNYEILQSIYDAIAPTDVQGYTLIKQSVGFKRLHLYPGCKIRCLDSSNHYYNGQLLTVSNITSTFIVGIDVNTDREIVIEKVNGSYPVGPANLLTVHKSQGYTLPDVIICYDNMFEISMLYTAVTRASTSVSFYSTKEHSPKVLVETMHGRELEELSKFSMM